MVHDLFVPLGVVVAIYGDEFLVSGVSLVKLLGMSRLDEPVLSGMKENRWDGTPAGMLDRHKVLDVEVSQGLHPHAYHCECSVDEPGRYRDHQAIVLRKLLG